MKTKLSVVAILCCAQLWMGCAAKNPDESDVRGTSTAVLPAATLWLRQTSLACIGFSLATSSTSVSI